MYVLGACTNSLLSLLCHEQKENESMQEKRMSRKVFVIMVSVLLCWTLLIGNQAVFAEEGDAGQDAAQKEEITKEVQKTDEITAAATAEEDSKDEDTVTEASDSSDAIEPKTEKEETAPAASEEPAAEEPAAAPASVTAPW